MAGLIYTATNADLEAAEQAERERAEQIRRERQQEQSIAGQIRRDWERAKQAKDKVQERLLDCLRRVNGEYSADKLAQIRQQGGSEIYMQLTATKCRAAASWVRDIMIPTGDKPWGLEPTPVVEIPVPLQQQIQQEVMQQIQMAAQQGQQVTPDQARQMLMGAVEDVKERANEAARKASSAMEDEIEDQLAEGCWDEALDLFIEDFVTFPAAILKGPVLRRQERLGWGNDWEPVKVSEIAPEFERVSPFDFYPSPDATTTDDAAYLIERVRFRRNQLQKLRGVPGYHEEAIDAVLREFGMGGLRDWILGDSERAKLEGREHEWLSSGDTIDALTYYGSCMGLQLLQHGFDPQQIDPLQEYNIEAILIGGYVIRLVIDNDPLGRRPYHVASFQRIPGAFWGTCPPELMADIQDTCNATARALINNLAIASGPQVEVNYDRLMPGEDADDIYPWKTWQTKSSQTTGNNPAVRFWQPSSMAGELLTVYEQFERRADDATNIPRYTYGNERVGGAGSTASGLSMLMESANKGIKAAISHIDKYVVRRVIEAMWLHNMMYHPDRALKGDCRVIARGSSALLARERTQMMRNEFLQLTSNPMDLEILGTEGRAKLLRTIAEQLDIHGLMPDTEQLEQQKAAQSQQQQQMQQQQMQLEMAEKQAAAEEKMARAQKLLAEANSQPLENQKTLAEIKKLLSEVGGMLDSNQNATAGAGAALIEGGRALPNPAAMAGTGAQQTGVRPDQYTGPGLAPATAGRMPNARRPY
jgi:hypothetical protein